MITVDEEWNGEDWTSLGLAAKEVAEALGISVGVAGAQLRDLCASGQVRAMKYDPSVLTAPEYIEPSEWSQGFPSHIYVALSTEDLQFSLAKRSADFERSQPKRDLARQAVTALWPNGVPKELINKVVEEKVAEWLKVQNFPRISRDTVLRAAGRK